MLILPTKGKWFDMILEGIKKEEYRKASSYYTSRFWNALNLGSGEKEPIACCKQGEGKQFFVLFRNGYSGNSRTFLAKVSLSYGKGKEEWGFVGEDCYILSIHGVYKKHGMAEGEDGRMHEGYLVSEGASSLIMDSKGTAWDCDGSTFRNDA